MANPSIYYYPDPAGTLEIIDFAEPLSDLQISEIREVSDSWSRAGSFYRATGASRLQIRIILENFTSASLVRQLESLSAHLEIGGTIGFALDPDKAWASFRTPAYSSPIRGASGLITTGNQWSAWSASASLATSDVVSISEPSPAGRRELCQISGPVASTATTVAFTGEPLRYTYESDVVLVRSRDFYPALIMPQSEVGGAILETNHRISYTLDLTLEEDWGTLVAMGELGAQLRDANGLPSSGGSYAEILAGYRAGLNDAWISAS